jgi:hypothetical protein
MKPIETEKGVYVHTTKTTATTTEENGRQSISMHISVQVPISFSLPKNVLDINTHHYEPLFLRCRKKQGTKGVIHPHQNRSTSLSRCFLLDAALKEPQAHACA